MPCGRVVNAWGEVRFLLLLEGGNLARIHVEGGLGLAVVELWAPDLSLGLESVHEVLRPVHVVARGSLVILHNAIGGE